MLKKPISIEQTLLFDDYFGAGNNTIGPLCEFEIIPIKGEMVRRWLNPCLPEGWLFLDRDELIYSHEGENITKSFRFTKHRDSASFIKKLLDISKEKNFYPQLLFKEYDVVVTYQNPKYFFVCDKCIEMADCTEMVAKNYYL